MKSLLDDVVKGRRNPRMLIEEAPKQSKDSNSVVERAVQSIEGMVRVLKNSLETCIEVKFCPENCIITWLVEYAGLLNRFEVGKDGKKQRVSVVVARALKF